PLSTDEVDLGPSAALLSLAEAERLTRTTTDEAGTPAEDEAERARPPDDSVTVTAHGGVAESADDDQRSVILEINATEDDLHTLQRALTGLRDVVKPGPMHIEVTVRAEHLDAPIDRIQFQNRVRQHLEEDEDVSFKERWE